MKNFSKTVTLIFKSYTKESYLFQKDKKKKNRVGVVFVIVPKILTFKTFFNNAIHCLVVRNFRHIFLSFVFMTCPEKSRGLSSEHIHIHQKDNHLMTFIQT